MQLITPIFSWVAIVVLLVYPSVASATAVSVGPFTGTYSESFETFPDYYQVPHLFPEPISIMSGFATISSAGHDMVIYNPGAGAFYGLGQIFAGVSDGSQGLGVGSVEDSVTVDFNSPVTAFGGYFAADTFDFSHTITFDFSDGSSSSFNYADSSNGSAPNGSLVWEGWGFSTGINSVTMSGNYFVMDGLQVAVPEPSSWALVGVGGLMAIAGRWCRRSL